MIFSTLKAFAVKVFSELVPPILRPKNHSVQKKSIQSDNVHMGIQFKAPPKGQSSHT